MGQIRASHEIAWPNATLLNRAGIAFDSRGYLGIALHLPEQGVFILS